MIFPRPEQPPVLQVLRITFHVQVASTTFECHFDQDIPETGNMESVFLPAERQQKNSYKNVTKITSLFLQNSADGQEELVNLGINRAITCIHPFI